jgi:hypothetical protein
MLLTLQLVRRVNWAHFIRENSLTALYRVFIEILIWWSCTNPKDHCRDQNQNVNHVEWQGTYIYGTYCSVKIRCYGTTARLADIPWPFVGNGSVNTFPQQQTRTHVVFSVWSVQWCYDQGIRLELIQLSVEIQFYTGVCEKRTSAGGSTIAIVRAVARKR